MEFCFLPYAADHYYISKWFELCKQYPSVGTLPFSHPHVIRDMPAVCLNLLQTLWHHSLFVHPLSIPITIKGGINQCTAVVSNDHLLPKQFPRKTSSPCNVVLNRRIDNLNSRRTTWLHKHPIYVQTLHYPSPYLCQARTMQEACKIKHRVVAVQNAQIWHLMLLNRL